MAYLATLVGFQAGVYNRDAAKFHAANLDAKVACPLYCATCKAERRYGREPNWPFAAFAR